MKKIVIVYGLISGSAVATMLLLSMPLWESGMVNFDNGEAVGYTTMVISLSLIFFGVKSYRDKHGNGAITFAKGVTIGLLISLIAAVMYALAWEVSYNTMTTDFTAKMVQHYLDEMAAGGATEAEIQASKENWATMMEYYQNPAIRFAITLTEILPVGVVITLISAALLRRKEFLPATEPA